MKRSIISIGLQTLGLSEVGCKAPLVKAQTVVCLNSSGAAEQNPTGPAESIKLPNCSRWFIFGGCVLFFAALRRAFLSDGILFWLRCSNNGHQRRRVRTGPLSLLFLSFPF